MNRLYARYEQLALPEPRFIECPKQQSVMVTVLTWRARLFSWPWRPWIRTKTVTVPDPGLYFNPQTFTYSGHPETLKAYRARWAAKHIERN